MHWRNTVAPNGQRVHWHLVIGPWRGGGRENPSALGRSVCGVPFYASDPAAGSPRGRVCGQCRYVIGLELGVEFEPDPPPF